MGRKTTKKNATSTFFPNQEKITLPETNMFTPENGWKRKTFILSFWGPAYFQGAQPSRKLPQSPQAKVLRIDQHIGMT